VGVSRLGKPNIVIEFDVKGMFKGMVDRGMIVVEVVQVGAINGFHRLDGRREERNILGFVL
jgi:uncharacterized membrane protein